MAGHYSSHARKPRSFHDLEKRFIGNDYQKLTHIRDIITVMMDDLYEEQILEIDSLQASKEFKLLDFPNES